MEWWVAKGVFIIIAYRLYILVKLRLIMNQARFEIINSRGALIEILGTNTDSLYLRRHIGRYRSDF